MFNRDKIREASYGRLTDDITTILKSIPGSQNRSLLDVGCSNGNKTLKWAEGANIAPERIFGLDLTDEYLKEAKNKFVVFSVDFELQEFPFVDNTFDLILCSQVFEHIKNIHVVISEIFRVLKTGGYLILSTPNLASLHNRFLLSLGKQPTPIKVFSYHIRGFTINELKKFIQINPHLKIIKFYGSGFYPFMPIIGGEIAKVLPSLAVYTILLIQKTGEGNKNIWLDKFAQFVGDTHYHNPNLIKK